MSCRESNSVVVMSRSGQKLREVGAGRLDKPGGLCVTPQGRVVVANTGKNELAVFDADGSFVAAAGGLAAPEDVAAGADGTVYVADTGNSRIAVFDAELKGMLFSIEQVGEPPSKLKNPAGVRSPGYKGDSDTDFEGKVHKLNEGELHWLDRKAPKGKIALDGRRLRAQEASTDGHRFPQMKRRAACGFRPRSTSCLVCVNLCESVDKTLLGSGRQVRRRSGT